MLTYSRGNVGGGGLEVVVVAENPSFVFIKNGCQ